MEREAENLGTTFPRMPFQWSCGLNSNSTYGSTGPMAQLEKHATLDLGAVSLSPTLGTEITINRSTHTYTYIKSSRLTFFFAPGH